MSAACTPASIVILNDNDMSIAPPVGAMSHYLSRTVSSKGYRKLRNLAKRVVRKIGLATWTRKAEHSIRNFTMGGDLFDALGFYYVGPIDGHDINVLLPVLENVRDMDNGPVLIHVVTQKGKGYAPAESADDKYHGVSKFNVVTGEQAKAQGGPAVLHESVRAGAGRGWPRKTRRSSASPRPCRRAPGSIYFATKFPDRCFDVGIAEQHAVTFAAGLAAEGMKPFCGDLLDLPAARL